MRIQPNDEPGDRTPPSPAAEESGTLSAGARGPGSRLRLRNWRVRRRLIALILIPTVVAVAFGGLRISTSVGRAQTYSRVEHLAELGSQITALVHALSSERDLTAAYIADNRNPTLLSRVQQQYPKADAAAVQVRRLSAGIDGSYGSQVLANTTRMRNRLDAISNLRDNAAKTKMPAASVIIVYSESINDLLAFNDVIAQGAADETLTANVRALAAVSRAKEQASEQRALLYSATLNGALTVNDVSSLAAAQAREDSEVATFREAATFEQSQLYDDTVIGPDVDESSVLRQRAIALGLGGKAARRLDLDPDTTDDAGEWLKTSTAKIDLMREVEQKLAGQVIAGSKHRQSDAVRSAIMNAAAIAIVLILVLLVTLVMAQSLVRPLRKLRAGALEVAGHRLPDLVRRLRDAEAGNEPITVDPIDVHTTDEIGEVARSFDEVHREAVRLASNEALLRGNVNAMFVNLSRRSQSLIERQLRLIEDLEQSEQDASRLESLFKLDHLATRMRRNGENLLVLGGQEQTRRWNKPVPLVDIVRASLSEVEQYERVTLRIQDDVSVIGRVVNDLVHLVAELVENSTTFSPEHTKVAVSGHLLSGGGAMLQISDNGVGMSPEELEEANWKLANPPTIDVSISRRMGLFVVGRLAQRHGIRVELRAALSGGLTAFVILPASAIQDGNPPAPRRLDSPVEAAPRRSLGVEAPAVRGQLPRSPEPVASAPVPDTPWEPARNLREAARTASEPAPLDGEPPRSPVEPLRRPAEPVWDEPEPAEPVWGRREPERRPAEPAEPAYGQAEQPRGPQDAPLPKRKPANTSPPGRGAAPSAPGRPGSPAGAPPPARPSRPQNPPFPPSRQPARPPAAGSTREEGRLGDQNGGRSPIFEAMQSEWFQRRKTGSMAKSESTPPPDWSSPADDGFRAAETVRAPSVGGKTAAGLPKRVPGNNRIPGSIASARPAPQPQQPVQQSVQPPPRPAFQPPEAETVRNRFSSFQQGVRRGRAAIRPEDDERENQ
ncbi:nitrate- and nitrite sensing domain-containing protein [Actinoallomurus sp. NPDC052274]|uniref:sensor histidine kinase n=1 Tax=Actinoallomurus sp. NPDC052274 TaxID=3155420 RepID=UPI003441717B